MLNEAKMELVDTGCVACRKSGLRSSHIGFLKGEVFNFANTSFSRSFSLTKICRVNRISDSLLGRGWNHLVYTEMLT